MFADSAFSFAEADGLMVSPAPPKVIELPTRSHAIADVRDDADENLPAPEELDWLSQPLSGRSLVWTINGLVMVAALLLFALVFLSVTREPPRWPLAMSGAGAVLVVALYWGFFRVFGGTSPGARLARLAGCELEDDEDSRDSRFR